MVAPIPFSDSNESNPPLYFLKYLINANCLRNAYINQLPRSLLTYKDILPNQSLHQQIATYITKHNQAQ
jgi:hypothetical protein